MLLRKQNKPQNGTDGAFITFTMIKSVSGFGVCLLFCIHVSVDGQCAHYCTQHGCRIKGGIYPTTREPFLPLMDEKEVLAATATTFIN